MNEPIYIYIYNKRRPLQHCKMNSNTLSANVQYTSCYRTRVAVDTPHHTHIHTHICVCLILSNISIHIRVSINKREYTSIPTRNYVLKPIMFNSIEVLEKVFETPLFILSFLLLGVENCVTYLLVNASTRGTSIQSIKRPGKRGYCQRSE